MAVHTDGDRFTSAERRLLWQTWKTKRGTGGNTMMWQNDDDIRSSSYSPKGEEWHMSRRPTKVHEMNREWKCAGHTWHILQSVGDLFCKTPGAGSMIRSSSCWCTCGRDHEFLWLVIMYIMHVMLSTTRYAAWSSALNLLTLDIGSARLFVEKNSETTGSHHFLFTTDSPT